LLQRTRAGILMLLLAVLPLQGVVPLVAGLQGHRHVHTGAGHAEASSSLLRVVLDRLHAAQDPRLQALGTVSRGLSGLSGMSSELHQHGGVFHRHSQDAADVIDVHDASDDASQGGATAFLAWLPAALLLPAGEGGERPLAAEAGWRDRVVAPPLAPPRG